MPEPTPNTRGIIGMVMMVSAVTMFVIAALIYNGVIPLGADVRFIVALALGATAFVDLLIGMWFFRAGQSS